jgi:adenine deaminase
MNEVLSSRLWTRLRQLAKAAHRKYAAVAYVTDDRFVSFGEGEVLITDASDEAIKSGQTSASVLKAAHRRGAQVFSVAGLHSKLYVLIGTQSSDRRTCRRDRKNASRWLC